MDKIKEKKILIFTENYSYGGGIQYIYDFAMAAQVMFDEIHILINPEGFCEEELNKFKLLSTVHYVNVLSRARLRYKLSKFPKAIRGFPLAIASLLKPALWIYNYFLLIKKFKRIAPTLLLTANGGFPASFLVSEMAFIAAFQKCKCIYSIVSMPMPRRITSIKFLDSLLWKACTYVVVNAEIIGESLVDERGVPSEKIKVIYNGVEDRKTDRTYKRKKKIGSISRLSPEKGVAYLVEAFMAVIQKGHNSKLYIAGMGEQFLSLKNMLKKNDLRDEVELLGFYKGDVHNFLETIDIFVLPSLHEGLPYSILEAMRAGCGIIATNVGAVTEVLADNKNALIVKPACTEGIEEAIINLLTNTDQLIRLSSQARADFEKYHTKEKMHLQIQSLYQNIIMDY